MKKGELFIVSTPIGNLGDITFRAVETLKSVDFVVCEDTRVSKILFDKYQINSPRISLHARSSETKVNQIIQKISLGSSAAQISDAGTPLISDPGFALVRKAISAEIKVVPIPGASAFLASLPVSGLPINQFQFLGFLPHKKGRETFLKSLQNAEITSVFYESVHRIPRFLEQAESILGPERKICIAREITKKFESIFRGTISEAATHFSSPENLKGEFVVLVEPR